MYPHQELKWLVTHKAALRRRIAVRRAMCAVDAARLVRPLAWLDRAVAQWRRLSPFMKFAAVPLGFLLRKAVAPRVRGLGALLRWGPLALSAYRRLTGSGRR